MKTLTLHQPWAWAICHAGKRVENRSWAPPRALVGERIAIHAGLKLDEDGYEFVKVGNWGCREELWGRGSCPPKLPPPDGLIRGAIVATAVLADARRIEDIPQHELTQWHFGPWCWGLAEVIALPEPVPCRGRQGLWETPIFDGRST